MVRSDWGDLIKARQRRPRVKATAVVLPTQLEEELKKVRALSPPPPSDDPIYDYLTGVYRLTTFSPTLTKLVVIVGPIESGMASLALQALTDDAGRQSAR